MLFGYLSHFKEFRPVLGRVTAAAYKGQAREIAGDEAAGGLAGSPNMPLFQSFLSQPLTQS